MPTKVKKKKGPTTDQQKNPTSSRAKNLQDLMSNDFEDIEADFSKLVHHEYMRLHRQYRILEESTSALQSHKQSLKRKKNLVQITLAQKLNLETDLWNITSEAWAKKDLESKKSILRMLEDFTKRNYAIRACGKEITDMETNVDKTDKRLLDHRVKMLAIYGSTMTVAQIEKRKYVLENRLHHVSSQLSLKMTANKAIKEDISQMLVLRELYYNRLIELKKETNKIKSRMGEILYLATGAYDQRDTYINKVKYLHEKNESDSKAHVAEIKELNRIIHYDTKLYGFLTTKCKHREVLLTDTDRLYRHEVRHIKCADEILDQYHRSFEVILKYCKSKNLHTFLNIYKKTEQVNFALYTRTTDLNDEVKSLQEEILNIGMEISNTNQALLDYKNENKKELIVKYEVLKERGENYKRVKEQLIKSEGKLNDINEHLCKLFDLIGVDSILTFKRSKDEQKEAGADSDSRGCTLTNRNVKVNLTVFESRVAELLTRKAQYEARQLAQEGAGGPGRRVGELYGTGATVTGTRYGDTEKFSGGPFNALIEVTGMSGADEDDNKEMLERPIYYEEMVKMIQENLAQAEAAASKTKVAQSTMIPAMGASLALLQQFHPQ